MLKPFKGADAIEKHPRELVNNKGGVDLKPEGNIDTMKLIGAFAKKIAGKIMTGNFNFSAMQRPTMLSIPESHVKLLAQEVSLALQFFHRAGKETDDVERLKLIMSGLIGNLTYNCLRCAGLGPVNPTLGETYSV